MSQPARLIRPLTRTIFRSPTVPSRAAALQRRHALSPQLRHPAIKPSIAWPSRRSYSSEKSLSTSSPAEPVSENKEPTPRAAWRPAPHRNPDEPVYELYFTCKVCKHRSGHTVSKQGYHKGTVLIQCDGCKNRHLISDHLKIFSDKSVTLDQLLAAQGDAVQRGLADPNSDMEFWADAATKGGKPSKPSEDD